MDYESMSNEELLELYVVDSSNEELKEIVLNRMEEDDDDGGFDSEGRREEEIDFINIHSVLVKEGMEEEIPFEIGTEMYGTLHLEHGMETQLSVYFDNENFISTLMAGDEVIIRGFSSELESNFTYTITKTEDSYGSSMDGEHFSYDLC